MSRSLNRALTLPVQDNYPEMLGRICIINAPAVFRMLWGMVKGMIDARTQQKIEVGAPQRRQLTPWGHKRTRRPRLVLHAATRPQTTTTDPGPQLHGWAAQVGGRREYPRVPGRCASSSASNRVAADGPIAVSPHGASRRLAAYGQP